MQARTKRKKMASIFLFESMIAEKEQEIKNFFEKIVNQKRN